MVCQSVEASGPLRVAPSLYGIVDASNERAAWHGYSTVLRRTGGTRGEAHLDKFLAAPGKFLPGTRKTIFDIADPKQPAPIIETLKRTS